MKHVKCFKAGYPRPQFVRDNFTLLDGKWSFSYDDENRGEKEKWFVNFPVSRDIVVPYSYNTKNSTINEKDEHHFIWYARKINVNQNLDNKRLLLNFEGCDYITKVWVNGIFVGMHKGGYARFTFDITEAVKENTEAFVVIKVEDFKEATQPRGKQTWLKDPFGCWYEETNGIWKSIWYEVVNETYFTHFKITPCFDEYNVEFELNLNQIKNNLQAKIEITYDGNLIADTTIRLVRRISNIKIDINNDYDGFRVHYWTFDNPNLYDVKITLLDGSKVVEEIGTYFGFRAFLANKNCLLLNNNPVYSKLVLNQGYSRDGGLTLSEQEIIDDLIMTKNLGFNGVRMHQKVEDERFYYYADILGMMVWCEMPSPYEFKDATIENLMGEWIEVVKQFYNHPSIVVWVPINESWGVPRIVLDSTNQHLAEALYHVTKAYDRYRPVISNDGWEHVTSDIITLHNYAQNPDELYHFYNNVVDMLNGKHRVDYSQTRLPFANGYSYNGQPVIVSEFAGIGYQTGNDQGWGYGDKVSNDKAYLDRLQGMIQSIRKIDGICGLCVTQLTDVQQEINGIVDFDRKFKVDFEKISKVIKEN